MRPKLGDTSFGRFFENIKNKYCEGFFENQSR